MIQIFVIHRGGENYNLFTLLIGAMMFLPAIGALINCVRSKDGLKYINWKLGNPLYLFIGLFLPTIITIIAVLLFEFIGLGTNKYFLFENDQTNILKDIFLLGNDSQSAFYFMVNFIVTGVAYSLLTGLITLGEEIGWRGYLQKKLLENNSTLIALLFIGLTWGFWHLPLILSGYNYPENPILGGFIIFPLTTIFASFFLGWLTIKGKSIWPAVFAHGGVNSIMVVMDSIDFGEKKLLANFLILGIWAIIAIVSYQLILKNETIAPPISE